MKTACIKCQNIKNIFYPYPPQCYASPIIKDFDPIYGENYIVGYNECKDINKGDCLMFKDKQQQYEYIIMPAFNKNKKKWWQFWKE